MLRLRLVLLLLLVGFIATPLHAAAPAVRPAEWAQPVVGAQLKNFYRLDAKLYRSAQPDKADFAKLQRLGITTVLNLRDYHDDDDEAAGTTIKRVRVEMDAGKITPEQLLAALRVIQAADGPVLVHCWHGSDRTGTVSAAYRIVVQGWPREAAIDELVNGGYGYHAIYDNIPLLLRQLDVEALRRQLAIPAPVAAEPGARH